MFRRLVTGLSVWIILAVSVPAWAADYSYVQFTVHLRAGPGIDYPVVAILRPGVRVLVYGCLSDYSWCDVSVDADRGWVDAAYLDYVYGGRRVPIREYGPALALTIITFSILDYWTTHYRHRSWYRHRDEYRSRLGPHGREGRPPPVRQPLRRPPAHERAAPLLPRREGQSRFTPPRSGPAEAGPRSQRRGSRSAPERRAPRSEPDSSRKHQWAPGRSQPPAGTGNRFRQDSDE